MSNKKSLLALLLIFVITLILRYYNLMHDSPYFFNPDERNMAIAITQLRLPSNLKEIPSCVISELITHNPQLITNICNLNPHFFAYGQFPLYLAFASDQVIQSFWQSRLSRERPESDPGQARMTSFSSAIFWLRFYSALSSTLTVLIVFLISRKLFSYHLSLITSLLTAFTPGLIQSAHFGTTESLLTFFFMAAVYLSLRYLSDPSTSLGTGLGYLKFILLSSLTVGLALGSKLTGIFFFVPPGLAILIKTLQLKKNKKAPYFVGLLGYWMIGLLVIIGSIFIFILSSPYNLMDKQNFLGAVFGYEADVATGKYQAFYTHQFINTAPVVFQMEKIFPYVLGWPVFILGTVGFVLICVKQILKFLQFVVNRITYYVLGIKGKIASQDINILNTKYLILNTSFLIYLLPNSFLFAKWTRFMTPIFPFFSIFGGYLLNVILGRSKATTPESPDKDSGRALSSLARMTKNKLGYWIIGFLIFISILPGIAFMSVYTHEDSRVQASKWIYENIPDNAYVLSETANVVDIPVSIPSYNLQHTTYNYKVISFDFYHMDENPEIFPSLLSHLEKADYIFIPSRRIFTNHLRFPEKYPLTVKYYRLLFSGALGFEKVAEITSYPCVLPKNLDPDGFLPDDGVYRNQNNLCDLFSDEKAEETFTVFDHPVIRIYQKVHPYSLMQYKSMFEK